MMEVCNVNSGLLFEEMKYRQEDNKFRIQKFVAERFKQVTGFTVPQCDFLSVSRTFVNILKKRHHDTLLSAFFSWEPAV